MNRRECIVTVAGCFASLARAQGAYPARPVRVIVTQAAGGGADILARKVFSKLSFGQPVIVENKAGASGTVGLESVARAPADGYTLALSVGSAMTVLPKVMKRIPYDPQKDLVPVVQLGTTPLMLIVASAHPAKSLAEFVAQAKGKRRSVTFGSYGPASLGHLAGEALNRAAGIDMLHVPYKGAAPSITDLLGGQVTSIVADLGSSKAFLQSGKLRALAITGTRRVGAFPDIPTFSECGYPRLEQMKGWTGIWVAAGTDAAIEKRLAAEVGAAVNSAELRAAFEELGWEATGVSGSAFKTLINQESARWGRVINDIGGISLD